MKVIWKRGIENEKWKMLCDVNGGIKTKFKSKFRYPWNIFI